MLCALGLMYVPDPLQALGEAHRVLQAGRRAVAAVWGRRDACGWAGIFPVVDAHAHYLASIAPYRNGHGYEIPGKFVVVRGRRG